MRIWNTQLLVVVLSVTIVSGCTLFTPTSSPKDDADSTDSPTSIESARKVLTRLGALDGHTGSTCADCHSMNSDTIKLWTSNTTDIAEECFDGKILDELNTLDQQAAEKAIRCMSDDETQSDLEFSPSKVGFYSTAAQMPEFENLFLKAFPTDGDARYTSFKSDLKMPVDGQNFLNKEEYTALAQWVRFDTPFLDVLLENTVYPDTCTPFVSDKLKIHADQMKLTGWQAVNAEAGMAMFACDSSDSLTCFNQVDSNREAIFPIAENTTYGKGWTKDLSDSTIRIVHEIDFRTSFWMRTSADGRYIGNGRENGETSAAITDLQGLLTTTGARNISIDGDFDPAFFADNSGFMFQGDQGTGICRQSVLSDTSLTSIDWDHAGCSASSDHNVSLYQSVGSSLDGGDLLAVTGMFDSDSGSTTSFYSAFGADENAYIQTLSYDGNAYKTTSAINIKMPFQGDFATSPSGQLLLSRMTGIDSEHRPLPLGYKIYDLKSVDTNGVFSVETDELATICTAGRKGNFSFDERFLAYYMSVTLNDWQDLGYASATDAEFLSLVDRSANIFVYDLIKGTKTRVTRMNPGQFAQFPHFRSDGWLMFMVQEQDDRYAAASDAALILSK